MLRRLFGWLSLLISKLRSRQKPGDTSVTPSLPQDLYPESLNNAVCLMWGQKVSQVFRDRITWTARELGIDASDLMCVIAFESGRTFSASVRNAAGSGATGLIQFMPATAIHYFHSAEAIAAMSPGQRKAAGLAACDMLAAMTAEDQIRYVYRYLLPYKGRMGTLSDIYMAVLWPAAVGRPDDATLWTNTSHPKTYQQNGGLDINRDGVITKGEAAAKVAAMRNDGLRYAWKGVVNPGR